MDDTSRACNLAGCLDLAWKCKKTAQFRILRNKHCIKTCVDTFLSPFARAFGLLSIAVARLCSLSRPPLAPPPPPRTHSSGGKSRKVPQSGASSRGSNIAFSAAVVDVDDDNNINTGDEISHDDVGEFDHAATESKRYVVLRNPPVRGGRAQVPASYSADDAPCIS